MHKPNHMPCIVKQIVEPPTTCFSTNIGLEVEYRYNLPQNVPTFHGRVSYKAFSHFYTWYHKYMPIRPYSKKVLSFPTIYFSLWKDPILFIGCQPHIRFPIPKNVHKSKCHQVPPLNSHKCLKNPLQLGRIPLDNHLPKCKGIKQQVNQILFPI
jgi:hypothetical protein